MKKYHLFGKRCSLLVKNTSSIFHILDITFFVVIYYLSTLMVAFICFIDLNLLSYGATKRAWVTFT